MVIMELNHTAAYVLFMIIILLFSYFQDMHNIIVGYWNRKYQQWVASFVKLSVVLFHSGRNLILSIYIDCVFKIEERKLWFQKCYLGR